MKLLRYITYKLVTHKREYRLAAKADDMNIVLSEFRDYLYRKWKWEFDKDWDVWDKYNEMLNNNGIDL